ncbi:MAG: low affinity iron permease family protein [Bacteroidota bacterium]
MKKASKPREPNFFDKLASKVTAWTGSSVGFFCALAVVVVWAVTGPIFNFSETWQLVINTGTTIVTFLMVFLIQKSQNKDSLALQLKLNELVASHEFASNRLVNIENMTEEDLKVIQKYYKHLSQLSSKEENLQETRSIDEAEDHHQQKQQRNKEKHETHPKKRATQSNNTHNKKTSSRQS